MGSKILLVEDDNNLREIYEARLQAEGYDIVSAKDGEEALVLAKKERPDLIIADVMMPRVSGFEMLDILRNTPELKDVHVIMLTALGQAEDKTRADSLGADRYLVKSQVTLEDIVKAASDILAGVPANAAATAASTDSTQALTATPTIPIAVPVAVPPTVSAPTDTPMQNAATPPVQTPPSINIPVTAPIDDATPPPATALTATPPVPQDDATTSIPEPTGTDAQLVTDAVNDLVSGTPTIPVAPPSAPAPTAAVPPPVPADPAPPASALTMEPVIAPPAAPQMPVTPVAPTDNSPTIGPNGSVSRKAITPLPAGSTPERADLSELMTREGHTMSDSDPDFGNAHTPGNVITPGALGTAPTPPSQNPADPNNISL